MTFELGKYCRFGTSVKNLRDISPVLIVFRNRLKNMIWAKCCNCPQHECNLTSIAVNATKLINSRYGCAIQSVLNRIKAYQLSECEKLGVRYIESTRQNYRYKVVSTKESAASFAINSFILNDGFVLNWLFGSKSTFILYNTNLSRLNPIVIKWQSKQQKKALMPPSGVENLGQLTIEMVAQSLIDYRLQSDL